MDDTEQKLRELAESTQGMYDTLNGVPRIPNAMAERQASADDAEVWITLAHQVADEEYSAELARQIAAQGHDPSAQQCADIAARVVGRRYPQALRETLIQIGHAPDLTGVSPVYLAELNKRGVTEDDVAEVAQRLYPALDRKSAIAKWQQAAKAVNYDFRQGGETGPQGYYGTRESSD